MVGHVGRVRLAETDMDLRDGDLVGTAPPLSALVSTRELLTAGPHVVEVDTSGLPAGL